MSVEQLKRELSESVQGGVNSKLLKEAHGDILNRIKDGILKELALASTVKQTTVKSFLWFTSKEETVGGLQHIESLQSDLRVILGYESLLEAMQSEAEGAKANLETLNARS